MDPEIDYPQDVRVGFDVLVAYTDASSRSLIERQLVPQRLMLAQPILGSAQAMSDLLTKYKPAIGIS